MGADGVNGEVMAIFLLDLGHIPAAPWIKRKFIVILLLDDHPWGKWKKRLVIGLGWVVHRPVDVDIWNLSKSMEGDWEVLVKLLVKGQICPFLPLPHGDGGSPILLNFHEGVEDVHHEVDAVHLGNILHQQPTAQIGGINSHIRQEIAVEGHG